jgi:hypothetical protein
MRYFSDVIKLFKSYGFVPALNKKGTMIQLYTCSVCGRKQMGRFVLKTDRRAHAKACVCGRAEYSPKAMSSIRRQRRALEGL